MIMRKKDNTYKQVGFKKVRQADGTYKDVEYQYSKDSNGDYKLTFEKGFTREKSGALPLQLEGIGKPLKDYTIYGNAVQAATPSTDNPVEVQAVGEKTANLFDKNDCTVAGFINHNGNISAATHWFTTENYIKCSRTITITALNGLGNGAYIACYDEQKNLLGVCRITDANQNQSTINLIDGTKYIKTCSRDDNFDSFMLNEGETALPYEPYGYKIPVECRGENLFDKSTAEVYTAFLNANDWWVTSTDGAAASVRIQVEPNTTYTLSIEPSLAIFRISESSLENPLPTSVGLRTDRIVRSGSINEYTFTTSDTAKFIIFQGSFDSFDLWFNTLQLELGSTATEYESYHEPIKTPIFLDKPIHKIGDYADTLCYAEQKVERVIKELILTGEENWILPAQSTFRLVVNGYLRELKEICLCTHYKTTLNVKSHEALGDKNFSFLVSSSGNNYCYFKDGAIPDGAAWTAYLKEQYAAGTPVKIYYVLATPESESVELPKIPTLNGATVIDVDTEIEPSNVYLKYKSSK